MSEKRHIRKVPVFLDIEFNDSIPHEEIKTVVNNIANAIYNEINSGAIAPEETFTIKTRIMCKDVVLLTEEYKSDGLRHITVQDIEGKTPTEEEKPYDEAVELLRGILCESGQECEYDKDIYEFLKENNELPEDYTPYWEEEDEE
ncbi:MAG TPA: hypothetical protein PJ987_09565 [Bacteroidia bacterium]|nr:hypothetical protein [Bacteroidia bacterium]HMY42174.1 hypothetical protein [Chitinophagales bacterium]